MESHGMIEELKALRITIEGKGPEDFYCILTQELFVDPVVSTDGHTYERHAIEMWFEKHDVSPTTGKVVSKNLIPNQALKRMIAGFNKK
jgi:hypothetical protein